MRDIDNATNTIGESAAGEPHCYADLTSNGGFGARQILYNPATDGGIAITMEASRTYVRSRHIEFRRQHFEGTTVFGSPIFFVPPRATLC